MKVIIAGGGTAGHINPGIAIARHIRERHAEAGILFVGTQRGLETKLVPREGFELRFIKVRGFRRKLSVDTLKAVKELFQGILQARRIIKDFRPDLVIGTGGYVCGPVVFMASRMRIPTLIHEQNAFPGITNRILSRFVDVVAVSFKESEKYFKSAGRIVCTGNPVRAEIIEAGRQTMKAGTGKNRQKPTVVVVGGSLGAEKLNDTVVKMIKNLYSPDDFNLIFATGNSHYERISGELRETRIDTLSLVPYIYDAAHTYTSADIMVCRAGAITCSEVTVLGVPTIMIPSPNVAENHQEYNARSLERAGASVVILEKDLDHQLLYRQIMDLLNDRRKLDGMARNAKKIGVANAVEKIYSIASVLIKRRI